MNPLLPLILLTVSVLVVGQVLLKLGMSKAGRVGGGGATGVAKALVGALREPLVLAGFVLFGLSAVAWVYVLSRTQLSYAFPFLALGYLGVVLGAVFVLKERPSLEQWLGIGCVVVGVGLVAFGG